MIGLKTKECSGLMLNHLFRKINLFIFRDNPLKKCTKFPMKNQVNFRPGSTLNEEGFDLISSMTQMSQQWYNSVTSSGMGRGPLGQGPLGPPPMDSVPMNPGMENQVPFPPLDFTIPECSEPKYSPMSQQWSNDVTSSGVGRGAKGAGPLGLPPMNPGMENQVSFPPQGLLYQNAPNLNILQ